MVLDQQQLIRSYLSNYFFNAAKRNPRFSLRAFANKLGISNSALSEIMRGKRKVSREKALEFAEAMGLKASDRARIVEAFDTENRLEALKPVENPLREIILEPRLFHIMWDWRYFGVLALVRTSEGLMAAEDIARFLELSTEEVKSIVEGLIEVGVVTRLPSGKLAAEKVVFRTPDDFPDEFMSRRRLDGLQGAKRAIERKLDGERGFFATVSVDKSKLDQAQSIAEDFMKRLCLFLRDPKSSDVFEVQINIFPWTVQSPKRK